MEFDLDFSKKDFDKMLIPVYSTPDNADIIKGSILEKFPEFELNVKGIRITKLIKWIACVYDKESPFLNKYINLTERKFAALEFCKIDLKKRSGEMNEDIIKIVQNKSRNANRMIIAYVKAHRSTKYALIFALSKQFYDELLNIQNGSPKSKTGISSMQKNLENEQIEFFNGDKNLDLMMDFQEIIDYENIEKLRPEYMAEMLLTGGKTVEEAEIE